MNKNEIYKARLEALHQQIKTANQQVGEKVNSLQAKLDAYLASIAQEKQGESK